MRSLDESRSRRIPGQVWCALALAVALPFLTALAQAQPGSSLDMFEQEMVGLAHQSEAFVVNIEAQLPQPAAKRKMNILPRAASQAGQPRRIGSGIAVGDDDIITTASIVDGATSVQIRTRSGQVFPAHVVGIDRRTNIALLSAPGANLVVARLGESELVTPGSRILVVGSIPPEQPMSSFGTIQVDRGLVWGYSEVEMLQLNAPVIRGSSGAAVVNSEGTVVGMISGMLDDAAAPPDRSEPGGIAGYIVNSRVVASPAHTVSFAIPMDKAREIAAELKQNGRIDRGFLGLVVQRAESGVPGQPGVLVREVMPGGPAALAMIQAGDLILEYAGQSVSIGDQLTFLVSATRPGSRVQIRFLRKGLPGQTSAIIGVAPNRYAFSPVIPDAMPGFRDGVPFPEGIPEARLLPGQKPGSPGVRDSNQARRP